MNEHQKLQFRSSSAVGASHPKMLGSRIRSPIHLGGGSSIHPGPSFDWGTHQTAQNTLQSMCAIIAQISDGGLSTNPATNLVNGCRWLDSRNGIIGKTTKDNKGQACTIGTPDHLDRACPSARPGSDRHPTGKNASQSGQGHRDAGRRPNHESTRLNRSRPSTIRTSIPASQLHVQISRRAWDHPAWDHPTTRCIVDRQGANLAGNNNTNQISRSERTFTKETF